jgi:hypothetical protein
MADECRELRPSKAEQREASTLPTGVRSTRLPMWRTSQLLPLRRIRRLARLRMPRQLLPQLRQRRKIILPAKHHLPHIPRRTIHRIPPQRLVRSRRPRLPQHNKARKSRQIRRARIHRVKLDPLALQVNMLMPRHQLCQLPRLPLRQQMPARRHRRRTHRQHRRHHHPFQVPLHRNPIRRRAAHPHQPFTVFMNSL